MKSYCLVLSVLLVSGIAKADTVVLLPDDQKFSDNEQDIFVKTTIPGNFKTLEGIAGSLLALSGDAANTKLSNPFDPATIKSSGHYEGAKDLIFYFHGARREENGIVLSFSEEAMRYLNNTSAIQQYVKGTIKRTLLFHFPDEKNIHYEIDGKIVEDWDA